MPANVSATGILRDFNFTETIVQGETTIQKRLRLLLLFISF
jgi:hypothetical protein